MVVLGTCKHELKKYISEHTGRWARSGLKSLLYILMRLLQRPFPFAKQLLKRLSVQLDGNAKLRMAYFV